MNDNIWSLRSKIGIIKCWNVFFVQLFITDPFPLHQSCYFFNLYVFITSSRFHEYRILEYIKVFSGSDFRGNVSSIWSSVCWKYENFLYWKSSCKETKNPTKGCFKISSFYNFSMWIHLIFSTAGKYLLRVCPQISHPVIQMVPIFCTLSTSDNSNKTTQISGRCWSTSRISNRNQF